ncbi:MAG: hypothetical protein IPJ00_05825 [Saprospirales bacterium]|nr:hypothetical protein [Saprospirales bacterium]
MKSSIYLKLTEWEYWPMYIAIIPTVLFWLWFALRARRLFFFSAVNPSIESGGMMGESKIDIMRKIPEEYLPATVFVPKGTPWEKTLEDLKACGLRYPIIGKPNVGERGFRVVKIENEESLREYHASSSWDFLLQEFIGLPMEVSIMYHRFPGSAKGAVTSICLKEYLHVTGNGRATVRDLMASDKRAGLQVARFEAEFPELLEKVPAQGERLLLEPIGNHCRGTKFMDGNHLIDPGLSAVFDQLSRKMEGIYYGRFDMKCESLEDVRQGKGLKILEFNGVAGDPAHIYDPSIPIWKKYRDIYRHWKIMYRIYLVQRKNGVEPMDWQEARRTWRNYWGYLKGVEELKS